MLLSELTTMRVGGPARELVRASTYQGLVDAARQVWASGEGWLVLGGGSNVVVADEGFDGTVILVETRGIDRAMDFPGIRLRVQAGESWDGFVAHTVANGWSGVEALSGIPGSVGAAPVQNIGAYGQELESTVVSVDFLDYLSGDIQRLSRDDLGFGYRTSVLKRGRQGIVLAVEFELRAGAGAVAYPQLAAALGVPLGSSVPVDRVRAEVLALRASKGMVLDPDDPDSVSCGSFFTNPIVGENFARGLPAEAPRWPVEPEPRDVAVPLGEEPAPPPESDDRVKLSAAWLIERSGIHKGFRLPGSHAAISTKHTLAIVNRTGASAEEIAELARYVRERVLAEFGVLLQPEPNLIGLHI